MRFNESLPPFGHQRTARTPEGNFSFTYTHTLTIPSRPPQKLSRSHLLNSLTLAPLQPAKCPSRLSPTINRRRSRLWNEVNIHSWTARARKVYNNAESMGRQKSSLCAESLDRCFWWIIIYLETSRKKVVRPFSALSLPPPAYVFTLIFPFSF